MKFILGMVVVNLFSLFAFAQNPSLVSWDCSPKSASQKPLKVGLSELLKIKKVNALFNANGQVISFAAEIIDAEDLMNSNGKPVKSKVVNETFTIKDMKTGMLFELASDSKNSLTFAYALIHFLDIEVETAGPMPPGTFDATADLVLISTYSENYSPQTGVLKVPLVCKNTVVY